MHLPSSTSTSTITSLSKNTHPVFRRLSDKRTLAAARAGVTLDGVAARAHQVVQLGQLDDERIPIVLVEGPFLEVVLHEGRLQREVRLFLGTGLAGRGT